MSGWRDVPTADTITELREVVRKEGPVVLRVGSEMNDITVIRDDTPIQKFKPSDRGRGSTLSRCPLYPVFYDEEEDDLVEVLRVFLEGNPSFVKGTKGGITEIFNNIDSKWADAWREISYEYSDQLTEHPGLQARVEDHMHDVCPFCGAEVTELPSHLPDCEET